MDADGDLYILVAGEVQLSGPRFVPASYLIKLDSSAKKVLYQIALPFSAQVISVDSGGNTYLAGGNVIEKRGPGGTAVLYHKVLGGTSMAIYGIARDTDGRTYVTGRVNAGDLQATARALRPVASSADDCNGFVIRLDASGAIRRSATSLT